MPLSISCRKNQLKNIHLIAAARPNFMKVAPLFHALKSSDWCNPQIVHTGQHYDVNMSDVFFRDLQLPKPDYHLNVGSGSHAEQTGGVMIAYEKICMDNRPDCIIVVGDVNSTAACSMVGAKLWIPVVHLEAGLRSGDRTMPEEINRLITDAIADVLWTPSQDANENLEAEGVDSSKIDLIGNIMIDSFEMLRDKIEASNARGEIGLSEGNYGLVTLHRPSNVDQIATLQPIIDALEEASRKLPIVIVAHPRTVKNLKSFGMYDALRAAEQITLLDPLPYVKFMNVVSGAKAVITDSGGLQEETTYLGIPCLTLRDNTERPITVSLGTNRLIKADELREMLQSVMAGNWPRGAKPPLWDGKTAGRAAECLKHRLLGD